MNQAFKIINTVGLMNQTPTEEMVQKKWGQAPFRGKFKEKWGLAPFYVGNIYV
jgi:hypothetical protein